MIVCFIYVDMNATSPARVADRLNDRLPLIPFSKYLMVFSIGILLGELNFKAAILIGAAVFLGVVGARILIASWANSVEIDE